MALNPLQMLFGGSNTEQQSSSTPTNMNPFTSMLTPQLMSAFSQGAPQYNGPLAAGINPNESNVLGQLMGSTGDQSGNRGYLNDVLSGKYLPGQANGNPFLQNAITAAQRTTMQNLTDTVTRDLPGRFTSAGQFNQANNNGNGGSSAFDMSAALATRGAAQAMGDIATNMSNSAYGQERQAQQQAVGLNQQEVQNTISNLQSQALPRMIQQLGIQNGMQMFQTNMQGILQFLQTMAGTAQPVIGNQQQSTGQSNTQTGIFKLNPFNFMGGAGGGTAAGAT